MKMKARFIYFLSLIAGIHLNFFIANSAEIDPYPTIEIPIFHGGYEVQKIFDSSKETKSVTYQIQTNNPPTEVLEFYDAYFNGSGWRSSFEICQRNWEDLNDRTKTAEPIGRQLFASWERIELNLEAVLWIKYEMLDNERQNEVTVKCQLQPKTGK